MTRHASLLSLVLLALGVARVSGAQQASPPAPSPVPACDYRACALGIVPNGSGLAVVRGIDGSRVANLSFFWPRDVGGVLRGTDAHTVGADSAAAQARRAVQLRTMGATLTDAAFIAVTAAAVGALRAGRFRRADGVLAAAGAAALGLSVPFQFAADGALSRAVWWHNLRFAR